MASVRRSGVERWCTTAIEIAKSKVPRGWGRERMSATATEWGWCCEAIVTRLVDLRMDLLDQNLVESCVCSIWGYEDVGSQLNEELGSCVPVRANDEDITIYGEIFPIATSDVKAD